MALNSSMDDIEDALQYYTAVHFKIDYFITRDKDFIKQGLPALPISTHEAFLNDIWLKIVK